MFCCLFCSHLDRRSDRLGFFLTFLSQLRFFPVSTFFRLLFSTSFFCVFPYGDPLQCLYKEWSGEERKGGTEGEKEKKRKSIAYAAKT